ncbi:RagB/SusD family nutrient uptake outer membrane protein [Sphingobacterium paludis]|uniref:Putative outer membrane starch-binding protein n=1 Tax=Sphingobacterium paludis TaxID=1476465 RepID=A0A4R7DBP5_9SPHI|nr:RagB/SusD family nutrient uptake outer membrane protein [Sphingobacterium paludis]TDS17701.1 putative outer membrane starch-binding protein [Sphingobacterium paludis]
MKNYTIYIVVLCSGLLLAGCGKDFLNKNPQGALSEEQVLNSDGVEANLLGAYGILNGNVRGTWGNVGAAPSQWLFGEVPSDNAHKGSEPTDDPGMNLIELLTPNPASTHLTHMWQVYYEGVARCNRTLVLLRRDQEGENTISAARAVEIQAESRMLRAHYYFYLWRVFRNIPWIDENTAFDEAQTMPNNEDVYPRIVADAQFAVDNLPEAKINGEMGRMDRTTAKAYLGKLYLYQRNYGLALPLFKEVIGGKDITSMPFQNNFNVDTEDGPEVVMASKHAINPDGSGDNANVGDMLTGIHGTSPVGCCGFHQPSIDLVNAYKVDANGLPYFNNAYRVDPYLSDFGITDTAAKRRYVVSDTLRVDPRLDYTVGRRGVPYLDYGVMPGDGWIRAVSWGGPFIGMKSMINQSQFASNAVPGAPYITGLDVNIIRLADVILMAAECEVELGNLSGALAYVNAIRVRAATLPAKQVDAVDVANYLVAPYPSFPDVNYARNAVRMERRLELAMEGHRFYDLVRWGIAKETIESYSAFEGRYLPAYNGIIFNTWNNYYPIPQIEIDRSGRTLIQNDGYN